MAAIFVGEEPSSRDPAVSEWGNPVSHLADHRGVKPILLLDHKLEKGL